MAASVLLLLAALVAGDQPVILKPQDVTSQKMLVIIPGGKVPNEHYRQTGLAIQDALSDSNPPWVVIPSVFQRLCIISCASSSFCSPLHTSVEAALKLAKEQGWQRDDKDVWLAGHSLGATCANVLFQAYTSETFPYRGLIVMGGYVDEGGNFDLVHYPVPVLTLNVELDGGLARPGKISHWWRQFLDLRNQSGKDVAISSKPVVVVSAFILSKEVLPHLNHSNFCPGFDVKGDLPAEVPQAVATRLIAGSVAAFLKLHDLKVSVAVKAKAFGLLESQVNWTQKLMTPYLKAQGWERDAMNHSVSAEGAGPFCALAQRILAGLDHREDARLEVLDGFHVSSANLEHCHPNWTALKADSEPRLLVRSCSHTNYYPDFSNTGRFTSALEIGCKLLAATRIEQLLKVKALQDHLPCSDMNRLAVKVAEELALPSTRQRYQAKGRKWCFQPDSSSLAGPVWVFHDRLQLKENSSCMSVQSPAMLTELNAELYPGIHYCKLLSPARALDWMMTDSLKSGSDVSPLESEVMV